MYKRTGTNCGFSEWCFISVHATSLMKSFVIARGCFSYHSRTSLSVSNIASLHGRLMSLRESLYLRDDRGAWIYLISASGLWSLVFGLGYSIMTTSPNSNFQGLRTKD